MGPSPPVTMTASARPTAWVRAAVDPPQVVAHHHLVVVVEAGLGQAPPDLGGVAVDDLAQQQLGPDGQHLDLHASTSATVSLPYDPVIRARSQSPARPRSSRIIPSISGASRWERPTGVPSSTRSTSTSTTRPTCAALRSAVIRSWTASSRRDPFRRLRRRHLPGQAGRRRALLRGEGEEPGPVEAGRLQELGQAGDVVLVSPGKPDDEAERSAASGAAARIRVDQVEVRLAVAGAPHRPQQAARGVLQAQVEVGGHHRVAPPSRR